MDQFAIQSDDEMKEAKKQMRLDKKVLSIKGKYKVETLTFQEANERGLFGEGPVSV